MKFHLIVVLLFLKTCVKDYGDRGLVIIYREAGGGGGGGGGGPRGNVKYAMLDFS